MGVPVATYQSPGPWNNLYGNYDGTLLIEFSVTDDRIEIQGSGKFSDAAKVRSQLTDFSRQILSTVADEAALHSDGMPGFRLVKSRRS